MILLAAAALAADPAEPRFGPLDRPAQGVGVGVLLGYPAGLSVGWRMDSPFWFDAGLGWAWGAYAHLHADVLYSIVELPLDNIPDTHFPLSAGVGGRLRIEDGYLPYSMDFAVRVPINLAMQHDRLPIEVFAELVPGIAVAPRRYFVMEGGLGFRFYFDSASQLP